MRGFGKNAKLISAVGFLILIALIWFVGPFLGLETLEARMGAILLVMVLWVLSLMVGQLLAQRAGGMLEKMLQKEADGAVMGASADRRAEVNLLRQRLLGAIDTLKTSKLGTARGKAALYELPWYMIIGHPAAGKSSAILQSGLTFPFTDKAGIQGVGGTRNCDWFFSTEGVLLDTAGRYATQSEDRGEWVEFLKLLKRYRSKAPVNGIMVAISLPELAQHQSEGFVTYIRQVRERIHEIESTFGLQVPVYLIFTKLDLLGGFAQFFDGLDEKERNQVWGATLTHDQGSGFDISNAVRTQFETLYRGLQQIGEQKLAQSRGLESNPAYFAFPIEFNALKEAVIRFMTLLHEEDPYHGRPMLRGFYFTSALQDGAPRIAAAPRVSGLFDLARQGFSLRQSPASYSYFLRDLFREVIFPDQHLITRQTKPSGSRWRLVSMLLGLTVLASVCGGLTWSFIGNQKLIAQAEATRSQAQGMLARASIYDQLKGLNTLQGELETLRHYRVEGHPWQVGLGLYQGERIEAELRRDYFAGVERLMLAPVKQQLEVNLTELAMNGIKHVPTPTPAPAPAPVVTPTPAPEPTPTPAPAKPKPKPRPKSDGGGLPIIKISQFDVPLYATADETPAAKPEAALDQNYNALKTYLMLADRERLEAAHLSDQIPRHWREWLDANKGTHSLEEMNREAEKVVAFYLSQLTEPDLPLITNKSDVVNGAREVLRSSVQRLSATERVYAELKARANTRHAPLTLSRILGGKDLDIMAASAMVPGAFTRDAWDKYLSTAVVDASKGEIKSDDWVLATSLKDDLGADGNAERNRQEIEALYRKEYAAAWKNFLQSVSVRDFASLPQAADALGRLSNPQTSPIKVVLTRAALETSWDNDSALSQKLNKAQQSVLEKTTSFFKGDEAKQVEGQQAVKGLGEVGAQFAGLYQLTRTPEGEALLGGYLEQLAKLKARLTTMTATDQPGASARQLMQATLNGSGSELSDGLQYVENSLLASQPGDTRELIRPMLVRPLMQTYSTLLSPVAADINAAWQREVYGQWKSLSGKYPFADSQAEAQFSDINRFIKQGDGTLDKFTDQYLNGLVTKGAGSLVPRTWGNMGLTFNPLFLSGAAKLADAGSLVSQDGDSARFELQPVPTPGASEMVVEIDGQTLRYRNGPQLWQTFGWPSQTGQGAKVQVVAYNGTSDVVVSQQGRMAWPRLVAQARASDSGSAQTLSWQWKRNDGSVEEVRVNFRMVSGVNPAQLSSLRRIALPERIVQ
ncbi:type VI secretion system membrane subunit TssM [Chitinibacteraceae bacterium HSL-7]